MSAATQNEMERLRRELEQLKAERDALVAHAERLRERLGVCRLHACYSIGESDALSVQLTTIREVANEALKETPTISLSRLKAEWQAEVLEELAYSFAEAYAERIRYEARKLRRQAEEPHHD